jgi:hypothetical protein
MIVYRFARLRRGSVRLQRLHDRDPGQKDDAAALGGRQQNLRGKLPMGRGGFLPGQRSHILTGVAQSDELAAIRKNYRIIIGSLPSVQWRQPFRSNVVLKPFGSRGAAPSRVWLHQGHGAPAPRHPQACSPSHGLSGWFSQTDPQASQTGQFHGLPQSGLTSAPRFPQLWPTNLSSISESRRLSGQLSASIVIEWPHL